MLLISLFGVFEVKASDKELRGVWVASVYNLDFPSRPSLSENELCAEADLIIKKLKDMGQNALFLQVRPCADALYRSDIFPSSVYLTGTQGKEVNFDPLEYFAEKAHKNGIKLFAWINPYRITVSRSESKQDALNSLSNAHPAVIYPDSCVFAGDGRLYFDPGSLKAREIIIDGVKEIVEKYAVDGVQYDDYFYPHTDFDDSKSYSENSSDNEELSEFRRRSVNELISETSHICRKYGKEFGVSPSGIWACASDMEGGVNTKGDQSYFSSFADSKKWVESRWVDHVAPQLYWAQGGDEGEFETLLSWWTTLAEKNNVKLYIGIAAYRSAETTALPPWKDGEEILSQLDMIEMKGRAEGYIFFRYGSLLNSNLYKELSLRKTQKNEVISKTNSINENDFKILSGGNCVSGAARNILCTARTGEKATVICGGKIYKTVKRNGVLSACIKQGKTPALVIGDRFGCISVRIERACVIEPEPPAKITDINCYKEGEYDVFEFSANRACAARSEINNGYLKLYISPCVSGYIFESPLIKKVVTDEKNKVLCYTFILNAEVKEHFVREYDDKVALYIKTF